MRCQTAVKRQGAAFALVVALAASSDGADEASRATRIASPPAETPLEFEILQTNADGISTFVRGRLGQVGTPSADRDGAEAALGRRRSEKPRRDSFAGPWLSTGIRRV